MALMVNNLTGFGGGGGGVSFVLTDTDITPTNTNSPSFTDMDAGASNGNRLIKAALCCFDDDADDATFWPATCTIGGVTATKDVSKSRSVAAPRSYGNAIYSAIVPNGTTATVAITIAFSGTMDKWGCALFRALGFNATPTDTDVSDDQCTLNTSAAKFVIVNAIDNATPAADFTGGGNIQTAFLRDELTVAYDDAPLGGSADVYNSSSGNAFSGAAYG